MTASSRRFRKPRRIAEPIVIENVLAGGVTTFPRVDSHGKGLSYLLAGIDFPDAADR